MAFVDQHWSFSYVSSVDEDHAMFAVNTVQFQRPEHNISRGIDNLIESTWVPQRDILRECFIYLFTTPDFSRFYQYNFDLFFHHPEIEPMCSSTFDMSAVKLPLINAESPSLPLVNLPFMNLFYAYSRVRGGSKFVWPSLHFSTSPMQ